MASAGVKGFFREKKKKISKPEAAKKKGKQCGTPALISPASSLDLLDEHDEKEEVLRQFDLNMAYGPCLGMSRLERWERADKLGLNPPPEVETLLGMEKVNNLCLWDARV